MSSKWKEKKGARDKRQKEKMEITIEGTRITEMEWGTVLGLTWNTDLSRKKHTEKMIGKFNRRQYGASRDMKKGKEELVDRILLSQIR